MCQIEYVLFANRNAKIKVFKSLHITILTFSIGMWILTEKEKGKVPGHEIHKKDERCYKNGYDYKFYNWERARGGTSCEIHQAESFEMILAHQHE